MPRSLMFHITWWVASVCRETKSQKVSCADWAWGISRSGCGLAGVDDVGELDAVLDEEDRHVVADQVERALVGVELHREAPGVADRVGGPREPSTVEKRVKTFVWRPFPFRNAALVTELALPYASNTP